MGGIWDEESSEKHFTFIIERCTEKNKPKIGCADPKQIDIFIDDLIVQTWAAVENLDFGIRSGKPVYEFVD